MFERYPETLEEKLGAIVLNQNSNNGIKRSPALWTGLSASLALPCFFLWIRFFLCWAFLFSRLILPGFSCLFRHTIKFKVSELFTHGCGVFLSVLSCYPFRSGNCTTRLSKQRYAYKGKRDIGSRLAARTYCIHAVVGVPIAIGIFHRPHE